MLLRQHGEERFLHQLVTNQLIARHRQSQQSQINRSLVQALQQGWRNFFNYADGDAGMLTRKAAEHGWKKIWRDRRNRAQDYLSALYAGHLTNLNACLAYLTQDRLCLWQKCLSELGQTRRAWETVEKLRA